MVARLGPLPVVGRACMACSVRRYTYTYKQYQVRTSSASKNQLASIIIVSQTLCSRGCRPLSSTTTHHSLQQRSRRSKQRDIYVNNSPTLLLRSTYQVISYYCKRCLTSKSWCTRASICCCTATCIVRTAVLYSSSTLYYCNILRQPSLFCVRVLL